MIARLRGILDEVKPTGVILDVGGVGYELAVPFSTYEKIKDAKEVTLHVHTHLREDSLRLFGFFTLEEKRLFEMLLGISGIGPSMALSILSGIPIALLARAVRDESPELLTKVPGIGRTKAEKLVFELKRRIKKLEELSSEIAVKPSVRDDALEALLSLGFDERKASAAVEAILQREPATPIESLVKQSLKLLSA